MITKKRRVFKIKNKTKKQKEDINSIINFMKKYINILHGNSSKVFDTKNIDKLRNEFNLFAEKIDIFWKVCTKRENTNKCTRRLVDYYKEFKKYKENNYVLENQELAESDIDFYDLKKIDNHIHLSALMTSNELKKYMIKEQLSRKKQNITVFKMNTMIDNKNIHFNNSCRDRFDFNDFNNKYFIGKKGNKDSFKNLRQCFLKTNYGKNKLKYINTSNKKLNLHNLGSFNCNKSHYATITKIVSNIRNNQNTHLDLRISLYGKGEKELNNLASWFVKNNLQKINNIDWYIQIPRIPHILLKEQLLNSTDKFSVLINWYNNIFDPIKKAYKSRDNKLLTFLNKVKGFDSVDNEAEYETKYYRDIGTKINNKKIKIKINNKRNPFTYSMYLYFLWYYIGDLNKNIKNTREIFSLRPHCGELGPEHHLLTAYLLTDSICHGINLIDTNSSKITNPLKVLETNKNNTLLYLYCREKLGCAIAPISNNYLTRGYKCLHLDLLFNLGLNMSISSDDPLMFHLTEDPLLEDIIMVKNLYLLSFTDLVELINNSYIINGNFKPQIKLNNRNKIRTLLYNKFIKMTDL